MSNQGDKRYNVNIQGNVSGQVAIGPGISQIAESAVAGKGAEEGLRPLRPAQRQELARLRRLLGQHFNEDELRELALDLGLDYEDVVGGSKRAKVRELALYFHRQNRLDELVEVVKEQRPLVAW